MAVRKARWKQGLAREHGPWDMARGRCELQLRAGAFGLNPPNSPHKGVAASSHDLFSGGTDATRVLGPIFRSNGLAAGNVSGF